MHKRSSKMPTDVNQLARRVVELSTGEPVAEENPPARRPEKNEAAVALGRLGGLKGGKARAEKLSAKRRSEIAAKAARSRWSKKAQG
jgi:hypothetical protein